MKKLFILISLIAIMCNAHSQNSVKKVTISGHVVEANNNPVDPSPIFDVDGVIVTSIDHIYPSDVVSIEVLKTSSAAIYGAQGSYGVIKIKTVNR